MAAEVSMTGRQRLGILAGPVAAMGIASGIVTIAWMSLNPASSFEVLMLPISLLAVYVIFRNWHLGLLAIAAVVPLEALSLPGTSLTIARLVVPITVLSMLYDASRDPLLKARVTSSIRSTPIRVLFGYVGWSIVSILWAESTSQWMDQIPATVGFAALVFLASVAGRHLTMLVWFVAIMSAASGVLTAGWFSGSQRYITEFDRLSIGGANPNDIAVLLAVTVGVALGGWQRSRPMVAFSLVAGTVAAGAIVLTGSRSGAVALAATFLAVLITSMLSYYRPWSFGGVGFPLRTIAIGFVAVLVTGIGLSVLAQQSDVDYSGLANSGFERIVTLAQVESEADRSRRPEIWVPMVRSVASRPIEGIGAGNNAEASLREGVYSSSTPSRGAVAHNTTLQVLVDLGIVGLALYATPWILAVGIGVRQMLNSDRLAAGLIYGAAAWVVGGVATNLMDQKMAAMLLGSLLGLVIHSPPKKDFSATSSVVSPAIGSAGHDRT